MPKNTAKCAAQKNPQQGVMSNHLTTTERYTETKCYSMTQLNIPPGKTQPDEETAWCFPPSEAEQQPHNTASLKSLL